MDIVDRPLSATDQEYITEYVARGIATLRLDAQSTPPIIVPAIARHVEAERQQVAILDQDAYAVIILSMGYLWGTQVCHAYAWEWRLVGRGEDVATQIVSPQRAFVVHPLRFIKQFLDDSVRPSTIQLLFNMLEPAALVQSAPQAQPNGYQWLG